MLWYHRARYCPWLKFLLNLCVKCINCLIHTQFYAPQATLHAVIFLTFVMIYLLLFPAKSSLKSLKQTIEKHI